MRSWCVTVAVVVGVCCASVLAMMVAMPTSAVVAGSDLVVIAKVAANQEAGEKAVRFPGEKKAFKRYMQTSMLDVSEVLMDLSGRHRVGEKVEVAALAQKPRPQKPGLVIHMADGPSYPSLRVGSSYLMVLRKLPDSAQCYYLPADPRYFVLDSPQTKPRVAELRKMADIEKWAWGKSVNGLQLAVMPDREEVRMFKARRGRRGPAFAQAQLMYAAVVRNVTKDQAIAIPHYASDKYLSLSLTAEGQAERKIDLYTGVKLREEKFASKHVTVIQPGAMVIVARYGASPWGGHVSLKDVPAGPATLRCTFTAARDEAPDGTPLWRGTLTSGDTQLRMVAPPK